MQAIDPETPPIVNPTPPSHKNSTRVGSGLGASGGTIIGIALFFTWLTFVPSGCRVSYPPVTQTGWDMLTMPNRYFNDSLVIVPIVVAAFIILATSIRAWMGPTTLDPQWSGTALVSTVIGALYLINLAISFSPNPVVLKIFPGFYVEFVGVALALGDAIIFVLATNPTLPEAPPTHLARQALLSLTLGVITVGLLAIPIIASGRWALLLLLGSAIGAVAAITCGRSSRMASRRSWWFGRFGELLGYAAIAFIGYLLLAILIFALTY